LKVLSEGFFQLSGGKREVKAREVSKGASDGQVVVSAANLGEVPISGGLSAVSLADRLPAGLEAVSIEGFAWESEHKATCVLSTLTCTFEGSLAPFELLEVRIGVKVTAPSSSPIRC
jgi:hypothetical protein